MKDDGVVRIAEITMKKTNRTDICHKCGEKGRFLHNHTWWCSWENKGGAFNLVGKCKTLDMKEIERKKRERNYAVSND